MLIDWFANRLLQHVILLQNTFNHVTGIADHKSFMASSSIVKHVRETKFR